MKNLTSLIGSTHLVKIGSSSSGANFDNEKLFLGFKDIKIFLLLTVISDWLQINQFRINTRNMYYWLYWSADFISSWAFISVCAQPLSGIHTHIRETAK